MSEVFKATIGNIRMVPFNVPFSVVNGLLTIYEDADYNIRESVGISNIKSVSENVTVEDAILIVHNPGTDFILHEIYDSEDFFGAPTGWQIRRFKN